MNKWILLLLIPMTASLSFGQVRVVPYETAYALPMISDTPATNGYCRAMLAAVDVVTTLHTNQYHTSQYKETQYLTSYPLQVVETWVDIPEPKNLNYSVMGVAIRENPDVRITTVTETRELLVRFEGKEHHILLDTREVSSVREERRLKETWEVVK